MSVSEWTDETNQTTARQTGRLAEQFHCPPRRVSERAGGSERLSGRVILSVPGACPSLSVAEWLSVQAEAGAVSQSVSQSISQSLLHCTALRQIREAERARLGRTDRTETGQGCWLGGNKTDGWSSRILLLSCLAAPASPRLASLLFCPPHSRSCHLDFSLLSCLSLSVPCCWLAPAANATPAACQKQTSV